MKRYASMIAMAMLLAVPSISLASPQEVPATLELRNCGIPMRTVVRILKHVRPHFEQEAGEHVPLGELIRNYRRGNLTIVYLGYDAAAGGDVYQVTFRGCVIEAIGDF